MKAAIARGIANKAVPSTGIVRSLFAFMIRETPRYGSRQSALGKKAVQGRPGAWGAVSISGDGGGGEGLMGQSQGNVAIDKAPRGAGTSARAWNPPMQPLAPEVFLRSSGRFRPQRGAQMQSYHPRQAKPGIPPIPTWAQREPTDLALTSLPPSHEKDLADFLNRPNWHFPDMRSSALFLFLMKAGGPIAIGNSRLVSRRRSSLPSPLETWTGSTQQSLSYFSGGGCRCPLFLLSSRS